MSGSNTTRAFDYLRKLPRVNLNNLKPNPGARKTKRSLRGPAAGPKRPGRGRPMRVGFEAHTLPFYLRFPVQTWNADMRARLHYQPLPLEKLQLMIDTERVRTDIPLDLTQLNLSGLFRIKPLEKCGGFILQNEGLDNFSATINLEIQWATEPVIAAIERCGGTITTAYYDPFSMQCAVNPPAFFTKGVPIPRRMLPPQKLVDYYSNPANRGYLADPDKIAEERLNLAQKYGYELPDISTSPKKDLLLERKDPRQVFRGLQPGWIVNIADKLILKPKDEELKEYYKS